MSAYAKMTPVDSFCLSCWRYYLPVWECKGNSTRGRTIQGPRTMHDRVKMSVDDAGFGRATQDRAPPLKQASFGLTVELYCTGPCTHFVYNNTYYRHSQHYVHGCLDVLRALQCCMCVAPIITVYIALSKECVSI